MLHTYSARVAEPLFSLLHREREVLRHLALGLTPREVAKALFISESTVRNHVRNVLDKVTRATPPEA